MNKQYWYIQRVDSDLLYYMKLKHLQYSNYKRDSYCVNNINDWYYNAIDEERGWTQSISKEELDRLPELDWLEPGQATIIEMFKSGNYNILEEGRAKDIYDSIKSI